MKKKLTFRKHIDTLHAYYFKKKKELSPEDKEIKRLCESSLYYFSQYAWKHSTGKDFVPSLTIASISKHLDALYNRDIRNLVINAPPRIGKTELCFVMFPAWVWAKNPSQKFLCTAYSRALSIKASVSCRRLIKSDWYQNLWGDAFRLTREVSSKQHFDNDKYGERLSTSFTSATTGFGGDFILIDDPNDVLKIESDKLRERVYEIYSGVISSRVQNMKTTCQLIVQQRTHTQDLSGCVLNSKFSNWTHLFLPMEYDVDYNCKTYVNGKLFWKDPRKVEGDLLWPQGCGEQELEDQKQKFNFDSYKISGQLQQRPSPKGGGLFKKEWFQYWDEDSLPAFSFIIQSWDTALTTNVDSCYSACTTWGIFNYKNITNVMLLSLFQDKIEYPDLRIRAMTLADDFTMTNYSDALHPHLWLKNNSRGKRPDITLIEAKVNGYCLHSDLCRTNVPALKFNPNAYGDKYARARVTSHLFENGRVWLRKEYPHFAYPTYSSSIFLNAATSFPKGEGKDIIDSASQALIYAQERDYLRNAFDREITLPGSSPYQPRSYV